MAVAVVEREQRQPLRSGFRLVARPELRPGAAARATGATERQPRRRPALRECGGYWAALLAQKWPVRPPAARDAGAPSCAGAFAM